MALSFVTAWVSGTYVQPGEFEPCDCAQVAAHNVACYTSMWRNHANAHPRTLDDLESLLETLHEGDEKDLKQLEASGCGVDERTERCVEQCMEQVWERHLSRIREVKEPVTRWGSLTLAFEAYMDIGAPDEVRAKLEQVATDLLEQPRDPITTAALLRLMELY